MADQLSFSPADASNAYEKYLVPALFVPAASLLLQRVKPREGERVLDVACGTGVVARQAAPLVGAQGNVTAIDLNPAMLTVARAASQPDGARIDWQLGSAQSLPFGDNSFDIVFCQQGLQFFSDKSGALKEMRRVLAVSGRFGISVHQSLDKNPVYAAFNDSMLRNLGLPALLAPFTMGDSEELHVLLSSAGFQGIDVERISYEVRFPSFGAFIEGTMIGSAAAVTAFAAMDMPTRTRVTTTVSAEMKETFADFVTVEGFIFPLATIIATAHT